MLTLLFLSLPRTANADCVGGDTSDGPDCQTSCDSLQQAKKVECEGLHVPTSDIYWQWFPSGCTYTMDGCPSAALGQCRSYNINTGPIFEGM